MRLFYSEDRDEDFIAACETARRTITRQASISEIARIAAYLPARSFYLSPRETRRVIKRVREGNIPDFRSTARANMYADMSRLVARIENESPGISNKKLVAAVMDSGAPRFYISPARAVSMYYAHLRKSGKNEKGRHPEGK